MIELSARPKHEEQDAEIALALRFAQMMYEIEAIKADQRDQSAQN